MTFSWWTFLFEALNFLVLAYVLHRLLYRPIHEAIDARRAAATRAQAEAEKMHKEALAMQQRLEQEQAEQEQQRQELMRKTREQAEADRRRILAEAEQTAQHRQEALRQALERDRDEALQALRAEVIRQAVQLSERLLREAAGKGLQEQLVRHLVETLDAIPPEERARINAEWEAADGAVLETAVDPKEIDLQPLRSAMARLLGREDKLAVQERPELVSGVRLRLGGHVWDASLAGQMEDARNSQVEGAAHG